MLYCEVMLRRVAPWLAPFVIGCASTTATLTTDASVSDVAVVPDALVCTPGEFTLTRNDPEVLLVIDRSGSMALDLSGGTGRPSRWEALQESLSGSLAAYDDSVAMGALFFPDPSVRVDCAVASSPTVSPRRGALASVLGVFARGTDGRTPTWAALRSAGAYLGARAAPGRSLAMVLATDGAPNCNGSLDGQRCTCTGLGGTGQQSCEVDPALCLDDQRTVEAVLTLARQGIPTYVVGIDGDDDPTLVTVLDRLATAGGRPNPASAGQRRYYSARSPEDLASAFDAIQRSITRCELHAPSRPSDEDSVDVLVDGVAVARDRSRADGWDWTSTSGATLGLYGATCERLSSGAGVVRVRFGCRQ